MNPKNFVAALWIVAPQVSGIAKGIRRVRTIRVVGERPFGSHGCVRNKHFRKLLAVWGLTKTGMHPTHLLLAHRLLSLYARKSMKTW